MSSLSFRPRAGLRAVLCSLAIVAVSLSQIAADLVPSDKPASYPDWWFSRSVVPRLDPTNTTPSWLTDYRQPDDFAILNEGQLKALATAAYDELQASLTGGAGTTVEDMVKGWYNLVGDNLPAPGSRTPKPGVDPYRAVNQGQLKSVAKPFYDRLKALHLCPGYPWSYANGPSDDFATANLGQAKNLFRFPVGSPIDGTPEWFAGASGLNTSLQDHDGDGISDADEVRNGTNPLDADSDHDGVPDALDLFPLDPTRAGPLPVRHYVPIYLGDLLGTEDFRFEQERLTLDDDGKITYQIFGADAITVKTWPPSASTPDVTVPYETPAPSSIQDVITASSHYIGIGHYFYNTNYEGYPTEGLYEAFFRRRYETTMPAAGFEYDPNAPTYPFLGDYQRARFTDSGIKCVNKFDGTSLIDEEATGAFTPLSSNGDVPIGFSTSGVAGIWDQKRSATDSSRAWYFPANNPYTSLTAAQTLGEGGLGPRLVLWQDGIDYYYDLQTIGGSGFGGFPHTTFLSILPAGYRSNIRSSQFLNLAAAINSHGDALITMDLRDEVPNSPWETRQLLYVPRTAEEAKTLPTLYATDIDASFIVSKVAANGTILVNAGGSPFVLVPADIVDKDKKKELNRLKVAKMVEPGVLTASGTSATLDPEKDSDRFYIRIPGGASFGTGSLKIATIDNPDPSYDDNETEVDLHIEGSDLYTKSMLLVSDSVDDGQKVDGIEDDAKNDRTHRIQLGGNLQITTLKLGGKDYQSGIKTPVPFVKTVKVKFFNCTSGVFSKTPVYTQTRLDSQVARIKERFAQCGLKADVTTTAGADLGFTKGIAPMTVNADGSITISADCKRLCASMPVAEDEIGVYAVGYMIDTGGDKGRTAVSQYMSAEDKAAGFGDKCIISADYANPQTTAHELMHVLLNAKHEDYEDEYDNLIMLWHPSVFNKSILDTKRISVLQAARIVGTPGNPAKSKFPQ